MHVEFLRWMLGYALTRKAIDFVYPPYWTTGRTSVMLSGTTGRRKVWGRMA